MGASKTVYAKINPGSIADVEGIHIQTTASTWSAYTGDLVYSEGNEYWSGENQPVPPRGSLSYQMSYRQFHACSAEITYRGGLFGWQKKTEIVLITGQTKEELLKAIEGNRPIKLELFNYEGKYRKYRGRNIPYRGICETEAGWTHNDGKRLTKRRVAELVSKNG